ncbi:DUF5693 family protein [Armatimonas rosea]|uniref:Uncharacterized protein n=1 Tax=Armatimonas rosea TaxID=685828 RepID=A0A7W9W9F3_ARMRO|nr:DUF5693 family protein [Armatimonas rosea]MBB6053236.1 hypothetical protein [Armatimonas rosea]
MQNLRVALWVMIGIGMLAGLYGAVERFRVEQKNRRVELTLDMTELQKLALAEGKPLPVVLQKFKQQGIQSVAITEDTLGSLEESRRVEIVPSALRGFTYLMAHQGNFGRIAAALLHRTHLRPDPGNPNAELSFPPDYEKLKAQDIGLQLHHPFSLVKSLGVGLDPDLVSIARAAHLGVVGRVGNSPNIPDAGIGWTLDQLKQQGVHTVIFSGDDVLGYDKKLEATRDALEKTGLRFGTVEFSKMKGDAVLQKLAASHVIRVHTVLGTEMATATPEDNVQRFSLAARERNMRLLYIRLFLDKPNPLDANLEYVGKIARALERGGLTIQPARANEPVSQTYPKFAVPRVVRALIGLGVAAAFLLLTDAFAGTLSNGRGLVGVGLGVVALGLVAGCFVTPKLGALAAAVIFAALAVVQPELFLPFDPTDKPLPTVLRRLARVVGIVTLGLTAVVGLLAEQVFLIKADAFVGIKLALYAPLLLATLYWALDLHAPSPLALWEKLKLRVRQGIALADDPIRLWQVAAALLALVVLALLWLRSGNDGAAVVTDFELRFRDLLDMTLPVRPRFKANLFGALMLGIYLAGRGERKLAIPVFLLGVIAVTDYLNTFCHLHIPLLVSVRRDILGLLLGALIGLALIALVERYGKRR